MFRPIFTNMLLEQLENEREVLTDMKLFIKREDWAEGFDCSEKT